MTVPIKSRTVYGDIKVVGILNDGVARFTLGHEHYFHKAKAWGVDEDAFQSILPLKPHAIEIVIVTGEALRLPIETFRRFSWVHAYQNFAPKRFVTERVWRKPPAEPKKDNEISTGEQCKLAFT